MEGLKILKGFLALFFLINIPQWVLASKGDPECNIVFNHASHALMSDSLPPPKKNTESSKDKPADIVIKEVPKAQRQAIPVPVIVKVKPVKIIKPKIKVIKPVLKILH